MGIKNLLGLRFPIEDHGEGVITAEDVDRIYIESDFLTGWMFKADFWERWGVVESPQFDS